MRRKSLLTILMFGCAATLLGQTGPQKRDYLDKAQIEVQGSVLKIVADDPRPLNQVINGLAERFHKWSFDYEDPRYDYPEDLIDNTPARLMAENPDGKHFYIPAGGSFSVTVKDFDDTNPKNELRTLEEIVKAYNKSKNPGRFKVLELDEKTFAIVGIGAAHGSQTPIMDAKISMNTGPVSADEALHQWADELGQKTSYKVLGDPVIASNLLMQKVVTVQADSLSAREVLRQIFKAAGDNYNWEWDLRFDYRENLFVLNPRR